MKDCKYFSLPKSLPGYTLITFRTILYVQGTCILTLPRIHFDVVKLNGYFMQDIVYYISIFPKTVRYYSFCMQVVHVHVVSYMYNEI